MRDRRVRIYGEGRPDRILSKKRFKRPLPPNEVVLIPQDEMVRRITLVRAQTPRCGECGGPT